MTRSDWLLIALTAEVERRKVIIDTDSTVKEIILAVEFPIKADGIGSVRSRFEHRATTMQFVPVDKSNGG